MTELVSATARELAIYQITANQLCAEKNHFRRFEVFNGKLEDGGMSSDFLGRNHLHLQITVSSIRAKRPPG